MPAEPAADDAPSLIDYQLSPWMAESLYSEWNTDIDGAGMMALRNRLNAGLTSPGLFLSGRLDFEKFYLEDPEKQQASADLYKDGARLEKLYLRMRSGRAQLELGDYYLCLGKGMSLCMQKIDELALDTTLRGGRYSLRGDRIEGELFGGLANPVNVAEMDEIYLPDTGDFISGAASSVRLWKLRLSSHVVSAVFDNDHDGAKPGVTQADRHLGGGLGLQLSGLPLGSSLNVEGDIMQTAYLRKLTSGGLKETERDGHAGYASLISRLDPFQILIEGKLGKGLGSGEALLASSVKDGAGTKHEIPYAVLPPLEEEGMYLRPDYFDQWGLRGRLDFTIPGTHSSLFVSGATMNDLVPDEKLGGGGGAKPVIITHDSWVRHVYGGLEFRADSIGAAGKASGGFRKENLDIVSRHTWSMWHVDGNFILPLGGRHSLDFNARSEHYDQKEAFKDDFSISGGALGWSLAPWVSLAFMYEYSTQPGVGLQKKHHLGGQFTWHFLPASYIKLFAGSTRGGMKCSGGMCRTFPPFEGVRSELTLRF